MRQIVLRAFMMMSLAAFVACANGADSSSVSSNNPAFAGGTIPLSVAERVTVVDAKDVSYGSSSGSSSVKALDADFRALAEYYYIPSGTPFYTDEASVYVNERSADMFKTVNEILCALESTGYKDMMNKGLYVAMVPNQCQQSAGSESNDVDYMKWVVESSRANGTAPHIIKVWFLLDEGDSEVGKIELRAEITESKSGSNPFGIFRVDYILYFGTSVDTLEPYARFFMRTYRDESTGKVLLDYALKQLQYGNDTQLAVMDRGEDNLSGSGSIHNLSFLWNSTTNQDDIPSEEAYNFAFNDTHFRRQDLINSVVTGDSCYFRNSFNEDVYSYGLYNVNGERFELNTGFPIKYIYNGADHYGYISYWGLSLYDEDAPLVSGDTLYRDDSSPSAGTAYQLLLARGKLTKHYIIQKTLDDFQNVKLNYSYYDYTNGQWQYEQLKWNGSVLNVTGLYNSITYDYDPVSPYPLDLTALDRQSLSVYGSYVGSIEIPLTGCVPYSATFPNGTYTVYDCSSPGPSGSTPIKMRQYATVKPTDTVAMSDLANGLLCFQYCPDASQVQAFTNPYYYSQSTDYSMLYQPNVSSTSGLVNTITYTFNPANMLLHDDAAGQDVVFGVPADISSYYYLDYGTGPMVANTTANLNLLQCDNDAGSTCADKAYNLPVYYTWQTGTSSGDHLALLKDQSTLDFFTFDEPLPLSYTYKGAGEYYGQTFILTYYGFDNWLSGIPSKCVDPDTWAEEDCSVSNVRYVNAFNIPFGGKLTFTEDDGTVDEYFAKALSKEQYMLKLNDTTPCGIINVTSYPLPDPDADWQDPSLGPVPVINAPPAVVAGELQTQNQ